MRFAQVSTSDVGYYELSWREMGQSWEQAQSVTVQAPSSSDKIEATAEGLNPQSTYALRLIVVGKGGNRGTPGPESIIDTDSISCTPKPKSGCGCVIS